MSNTSMTTQILYKTYSQAKATIDKYFVNSTPLVSVGHKKFTIGDVVACAVLSGTNTYFIGTRGSGKTLLSEAVYKGLFNSEGFYLRGDVNMQLKDLYLALNLQGSTDEQIYQIAPSIKFNICLVDELNRVPGVIQNQFLNVLDGYVEIRGRKYQLGVKDEKSKYVLTLATGNIQCDGEYTGVFDEDIALMNRISLVINTDSVPLAPGDVAEITRRKSSKERIENNSMRDEIVECNAALRAERESDPEVSATLSLLNEYAHRFYRYVQMSGGEVDKLNVPEWRDNLDSQHAAGNLNTYCSDIAVRSFVESPKLAFAMYKVAEVEAGLMKSLQYPVAWDDMKSFTEAYVAALKLALTYDRHFIPHDTQRALGKSRQEVLNGAFRELSNYINAEPFEEAVVALAEFYDAVKDGSLEKRCDNDRTLLENMSSIVSDGMNKGNTTFGALSGIIKNTMDRLAREERQKKLLGETGKSSIIIVSH